MYDNAVPHGELEQLERATVLAVLHALRHAADSGSGPRRLLDVTWQQRYCATTIWHDAVWTLPE